MSRADDLDAFAVVNRWMVRAWTAEREAAEAQRMNVSLQKDIGHLSTELVRERAHSTMLQHQLDAIRVRGISVLAQITPGPTVPEAGSIDAALAEQQKESGGAERI